MLEQLYALVNERYEAQRSLVVTTNLDEPELEEQIGARTVSRLVEMCGDPLPLFDEDRRMRDLGGRRLVAGRELGGRLDRQRRARPARPLAPGAQSGRRRPRPS